MQNASQPSGSWHRSRCDRTARFRALHTSSRHLAYEGAAWRPGRALSSCPSAQVAAVTADKFVFHLDL